MDIEIIVYSKNNWTGEDKKVIECFEHLEEFGIISRVFLYQGHGIRFFTRSFVAAMELVNDLVLETNKNINIKRIN